MPVSCRILSGFLHLCPVLKSGADDQMTNDPELSLLALLEWEERWARRESLPEADRARLVAELSRLMIRGRAGSSAPSVARSSACGFVSCAGGPSELASVGSDWSA